jgi:hypothetical protein
MDQIATEIGKINTKIDAVEQLLDKDYEDWTLREKEKFGNHEQLRKKEEQLRKKEQELLKQQTILLQSEHKCSGSLIIGTAMDIESSTVIQTPFKLEAVYTNEGVPGVFRTLRQETLAQFYLLLFPSQELRRNVLFIKAPPFSGKTGLGQLFCQLLGQDPKRSVVFLSGQEMNIGTEDFSSFFGRIVGYSLDSFLDRPEERVMILDEAQCTYSDERFWKVIVK